MQNLLFHLLIIMILEHCGFHSLVVMNNDIIEPGGGFGKHPHENAEIFTYVISGQLEHQDSMGMVQLFIPAIFSI